MASVIDKGLEQPQRHIFQVVSLAGKSNGYTVNVPIVSTFAVREIKFNASYLIQESKTAFIYVTHDMSPESNVAFSMTNLTNTDNSAYWYYASDFEQGRTISYILREPAVLQGSINFTFVISSSGTIASGSNCILHMELLG